ncbi:MULTISPECIES: hypothetical protein [unclassified Clostridioides]|uniref:hypothetical protein n=1 Tax=unclassified Clostridioides TaxID=2635829 RepID=UPI001D0C620F|nr:hypothetical protein [Clostridioides sp. ES-S-0001-02]MCC0640810.1 hypothetical protein [Clostridioides sp. ES-S-0049-03]MCC0653352.1 hypothetical protein [Clostridioides sp. ES-S-0001-03]MCC0656639.1 hypothetical protein [Clostridioides sp. ES-S-0123-01]MCC0676020.1 hypothetical protein [Clostridioides sp. ES-W-0018-02]MCC0710901.1 hypothetical protein [Clostridioides sp. ES-W-0017-02]UDN57792.1 hypothetical protein JJC01_16715 [Clostridioides sp. ES-S-0010-02]
MNDVLIKKVYTSSFNNGSKTLKDLIIINTKSLIDDKTQRCVYIDEKRLKDELIYFRFYGEKIGNVNFLNILLPLILSNTNIQKSEDEVVKLIKKYVSYFRKEEFLFDYLLSSVAYNSVMHNLINNSKIEYVELLQNIKDKIIGFSIELDKSDIVKFQMARIGTIQLIDKYIDLKYEDYDEESILSSVLNILYDIYIEDRNVENEGIKSMKKSILSILGEETELNEDNIDFILSMSEYVVKLRKYKIGVKMYNKKIEPRSLISLEEGDTTIDPIFNQITVMSKTFSDNILSIKIHSKSGIYILKFKKV